MKPDNIEINCNEERVRIILNNIPPNITMV